VTYEHTKHFAAKVRQGYECHKGRWYYFVDVAYKGEYHRAVTDFEGRQKYTEALYDELEQKAITHAKQRRKRTIIRRANNDSISNRRAQT
jgi:hypothetical protein